MGALLALEQVAENPTVELLGLRRCENLAGNAGVRLDPGVGLAPVGEHVEVVAAGLGRGTARCTSRSTIRLRASSTAGTASEHAHLTLPSRWKRSRPVERH